MRTRTYPLTAVRRLAVLLLTLVVLTASVGVAAADPGTVTSETTAEGELEEDDEQIPGTSKYYDEYAIRGSGGVATIDMIAETPGCFTDDTYLYLYDDSGNLVESDDDGGPDYLCSAQISRTLSNDDYVVRASSFASLDTFRYTLTLDGARFTDGERRYSEFEILAVNVSDTTPTVGEEFTVTVVVANVGNKEGRYAATLFADETRAGDRHTVRLDGGETATLTFTGSVDSRGDHRLMLRTENVADITAVLPE